jgi:hypothetical protein
LVICIIFITNLMDFIYPRRIYESIKSIGRAVSG